MSTMGDHIIAALVALAVLVPAAALYIIRGDIPTSLVALTSSIVGYYFGNRNAVLRSSDG